MRDKMKCFQLEQDAPPGKINGMNMVRVDKRNVGELNTMCCVLSANNLFPRVFQPD